MGRHTSDTGGGDFLPAPEGTHKARCIEIVDIGTHHGEYQGQPTVRNQIIVRWELPDETIENFESKEREPMIVSKFYTNSLGEKANLYGDLLSWRGREFTKEELKKFDLNTILGAPCLVTVVHNDKKKAKVTGVTKLVKGMDVPPAWNKPKAFWIEEWNGDTNSVPFKDLPKGFRELIMQSDEFKELQNPQQGVAKSSGGTTKHVDDFDDDIPFK